MAHALTEAERWGPAAPAAPAWEPELRGRAGAGLLLPLVTALALLFLVPLGWLARASLGDPPGLGNYADVLTHGAGIRAFENTLGVSAVVTVVSLLVGGFIAWELRNARSSAYRALLWATVLFPLWTSVVVRNYALTVILERHGIVNDALQALRISDGPVELLYTRTAVTIGMIHAMIPYAALPLYAAFVLVDGELVEAARSLGASSFRSFVSVVIPLALPTIAATLTLVYVVALGFYVTPTVLGGPRDLFAASLVDQQVNTLYDIPAAAAAAFLMLAAGLLAIAVASFAVGWRRLERAAA